MATYKAPLRDMQFVLNELLQVDQSLLALPGFDEITPDIINQYLESSAQFAENELAPLNQSGDIEGCKLENGVVTTPKGFKEAYQQFCEQGYSSICCAPAYGGQGMPLTLGLPLMEMQISANVAWSMYPGLSHGAYSALLAHGSEELRQRYLPKLVSGEWTGTMCLTEPQCGTDLGLIKTRAVANDDGSYSITGTKIFISAGEHDMAEKSCIWCWHGCRIRRKTSRGCRCFWCRNGYPMPPATPASATPSAPVRWSTRWASRETPLR